VAGAPGIAGVPRGGVYGPEGGNGPGRSAAGLCGVALPAGPASGTALAGALGGALIGEWGRPLVGVSGGPLTGVSGGGLVGALGIPAVPRSGPPLAVPPCWPAGCGRPGLTGEPVDAGRPGRAVRGGALLTKPVEGTAGGAAAAGGPGGGVTSDGSGSPR
jgi:hypothetical protein